MAVTPSENSQAGPTKLADAKPASGKVHLSYLDGVRACAALYVVCHHAMRFATTNALFHSFPPSHSNLIGTELYALFNNFGQDAVAVFICLSGFCLMIPAIRQRPEPTLTGGAASFFLKRAKRILPPYYAAIVLSLLMIVTVIGMPTGSLWDLCLPGAPYAIVSPWSLVTHLLLLQDLFPKVNGQIGGTLWSVAAEWRIYFLFPALIWAWRRFGAVPATMATLIASVLSAPLLFHLFHHLHIPIVIAATQLAPEYFGLFALGALGAGIALSANERLIALRARIPWGFLVLAPLAIRGFLMIPPITTFFVRIPLFGELLTQAFNVCVGTSAVALMTGIGLGHWGKVNRFFSGKLLAFVGSLSYSLYLIHYPIEAALYQYVVRSLPLSPAAQALVMIALSVPIAVGISYGLYRLVELPSHRWAGRGTKALRPIAV